MVAISAVGVWLSDDGGASWRHSNTGIVRSTCPRRRGTTRSSTAFTTCAGRLRGPSGSSCSSTEASTGRTTRVRRWIDIGEGLPSDFGFPVVVDPADPDSAYVIPLVGAEDRTTPAGTSASGRRGMPAPRGLRGETGFPGGDAYLTILREAFDSAGSGRASSSTSARRQATCSARATQAPPGRRRRPICHPSYSVRAA